ncbi:hypothetical protein G0Q06_12450 [Puniceicoccales bacterium CK1056]|uniref:Uncharacterized protein n=1 Tax=Oceanipulchritudo coccoides TaxID=2706888 RepID=A0A6B2M2T4_9BACT|nr:hypothetical protein [Oceanipulchritudo coccoides]NDV63268.1 hypothetical protein [Oceanipulchritudo coccoides]
MKIHYYLSLIPESLIASMLPPEEFGNYYALGSHKRSRGQAIFFEIDPEKAGDALDTKTAEEKCIPHEDGSPRKSSYLKIYRALEAIPTDALVRLYLTTDDGRTLTIEPGEYIAEEDRPLHLYQEVCPVNPRVVSKLNPIDFCKRLTSPTGPIHVPRIVFAEMKLEDLARDPDSMEVENLPYMNLDHLRDCLRELRHTYAKPNKTVIRQMKQDVLFRTIRGGFYLGDQESFVYFPLPSKEDLETIHYPWWRSALSGYGA